MKKTLLILIYISYSTVFTFGQDTIRPYYGGNENLKEYPRTNMKEAPKIKDAWLPNGQQIIYDGNGYREYGMWGEIRRYYYRDGDCDGLVIFFDTTKTKIHSIGYFYGDIREGPWISFYDNGQISNIITYKNDKSISDYQTFYENAALKSVTKLDTNGKANGKFVEYYKNGNEKQKGQFDLVLCDCSKLDSVNFEYQESVGHIVPKSIPVGDWTEYYQNGSIKKEMHYLPNCYLTIETDTIDENSWTTYLITNNCPDGKWKEYDENGKVIKTVIYRNCEMVKEK